MSDTSSRDYPRLYLESDYGQRTDRENDLDTDLERVDKEREKRIGSRSVNPHSLGSVLHMRHICRYDIRDRDDSPGRY